MFNLKGFYVNLISSVAGEYIDNISENLTVVEGFKGRFQIENLKLKDKAIDSISAIIGIPLKLHYGIIKKIELQLDWDSIVSSPCNILINDIHLLATPIHDINISFTEEKFHNLNNKSIESEFKNLLKNLVLSMDL